MFSVETPKKRFNANAVKFGGVHPYVVRTSQDNGRRGTIVADEKWLNPGKTISFGQDTATIFYQPEPYFTGDKIKVMSFLKGALNESVACYFLAAMRKSFASFSWGTSSFNENVLKEVVVSLPVVDEDSRQLDLAYMESYIRELESARVRELEKWLRASGFNDCSLTAVEQDALNDYRDGNVRLVEKKVTDIFDVANTHCVLGEWIVGREGDVPYVTASSANNSVSRYVDYKTEFMDRGNAIVIGGKTFVVTYQKDNFFSNDSHNLVLRLKDESRRVRDVYLYLVATINAGLGGLYSWGDSVSFKKIQKDKIVIPVTSAGALDFEFMQKFTRAVMKLAIRGVNEWKDCEIAETKKAVDLPSDSMLAIGVHDGDIAVRKAEEFLEAAGVPQRQVGDEYAMPPEETLS